MTDSLLRAGARVRFTVEDRVEYVNDTEIRLSSGISLDIPHGHPGVEVTEPGWQLGDQVDDGHGLLTRIRHDEVECWVRAADGYRVYDDETGLSSLTVVALQRDRT